MDRVLGFIARRHWTILALIVALSALAASQLVDLSTGEPRLRFDPSTNRLLPEEGEDKQFYDYVRKLFGSDETMIVALSADNAFTSDVLHRVERMTERIQAMREVHHVLSITNAVNLRGSEEGIEIGPFAREIPEDPEALDQLRREALDNPMYAGNLVSHDGRTVALVIYFLDFSDAEFIERGIDAAIAKIVREEAGPYEAWLTGGPHIKVAQFEYQYRDVLRSVPLMLLAFAVLLGISFRSVRGVVIPLVTVLVALLWTLGIAGAIGKPLNMVTQIVVPLFVILPLSYCVHVISEHYEQLGQHPELSSGEAGLAGLKLVWLPVVFTGLTTGAGFFALVLSPIGAIRDFGVLAVGGVAATVAASLTVPPALMSVMGRPRRIARTEGSDYFIRFASAMATFNLRYRKGIFAAAGLVVVAAVLLATQLRVGAIGIRTFPADSQVRLDFEAVNRSLQGATLFNVVVQASEEGAFKEPANLREIEALQEWLETQPEIGGSTSVVEYLKLCHRGFFENDPEHLSIPSSKRLVSQLLFFCSSDDLEGLLDGRAQTANVIVRANVIDTELVAALTRRIEARAAQLPEALTATVTGNQILMNRLFGQIVRGQAQSLLGAFVLIYLLLIVMFLDWRTAAKALVPNAIPVAFYFGALGATGITLNFATSLIAPMVLGIAIDDTIHYFSRFTQDAKSLADERQATVRSLLTVGRPVTFTTVVLCVGFAVLIGSDLRTLVQFGALASATLAFAWVVDFTLTPALCSGLRIVTLWDTLTLDLGDDPQNSIPFFSGLSNAQSRIVAQMANLREIPAGQPLMRVGDPGEDMYVIIDGSAQAWIEAPDAPDGRRIINTHTRGDVVGEVGLFTGAGRSLNVDVTEDARMLRLTPRNLERLRRRHPRTASTILRNLNVTQAQRLSKQTNRIR